MLNLRAALRRRPLLALIVLILLLVVGYAARGLGSGGDSQPSHSRSPAVTGSATSAARTTAGATGTVSASGQVALSSLPAQAAQTVRLIQAGGPFPYSRDGIVFNNAEGQLPRRSHGYYHEYTVPTPGESDRGARRIITGRSGEYFYTGDHYESFVRVDVTR